MRCDAASATYGCIHDVGGTFQSPNSSFDGQPFGNSSTVSVLPQAAYGHTTHIITLLARPLAKNAPDRPISLRTESDNLTPSTMTLESTRPGDRLLRPGVSTLLIICLLALPACRKTIWESAFTLSASQQVDFLKGKGTEPLAIKVAAANHETIRLEVRNLPESVRAVLSVDSGSGRFSSELQFFPIDPSQDVESFRTTLAASSGDRNLSLDIEVHVVKSRFRILAADTIDLGMLSSLPFEVAPVDGGSEDVTLTLENGPAFTTHSVVQAGRRPPFQASLLIADDKNLPTTEFSGITVRASEPTYTTTKQIVVRVPHWEGYTLNDKRFRARAEVSSELRLYRQGNTSGSPDVRIIPIGTNWPGTEGVYHFDLDPATPEPEFDLRYYANPGASDAYSSSGYRTPARLRLTVEGGRRHFRLDPVRLQRNLNDAGVFGMDVGE